MPGIPPQSPRNLPSQTHRRDAIVPERGHDAYRERGSLEDNSACTECGAVFFGGHWTWVKSMKAGPDVVCPACRRIADNYPAGFLTLTGAYATEHEAELVDVARIEEAAEKAEHPLNRIIATKVGPDGIEVTTTDTHTPRRIGEAIRHAFHGDLTIAYADEEASVRVRWTR